MKYFDERLIHPSELGMYKELDRMWIARENNAEWVFVSKKELKPSKLFKYIKDKVPVRKEI